MTIRMTGMASGLDTDSIISELMKAQRTKIESVEKKKTSTEWKVDAWSALNTKIYALYTGSLNEMRFTTNYNKKTTTISDSTVASVTADSTAVDGTQELAVKQLAKSGYLTGGTISTYDSTTLSSSSSLSQLTEDGTLGSGTFEVTVGSGSPTSITISGSSKISDVISQLKTAGINASYDATNKRIFVSSKSSGEASNFTITATDSNGLKALNALGLNASSDAATAEYSKWQSYVGLSYDSSYAGSDAAQIAYNAEYTSAYNSAKSSLETQKTTAETNLDTILTKYAAGYTSADRETAYTDLTGQKDTLTTQNTSLQEDILTYDGQIEVANAIIANDTATQEEKDAATVDLNLATANRLATVNSISSNTSTLADIDSATNYYDTITAKTAALDETTLATSVQAGLQAKAVAADSALTSGYSSGAVKIDGQDAEITLNGATFTSTSNAFSINGLNIVAKELTGTTTNAGGVIVDNTVSISTSQDYQGIYDTIKDFFTKYNALINEMDSLYNADSSKGYEPLTDDEKEAMTDTQIEDWETKIKDSLLRRDSTLESVSSSMKTSMLQTYDIGGTKYSLASFGIATGGYFTTDDNEHNAYHIDGDSDDSTVSTNSDKLMTAINTDPDAVVSFFTSLSKDLYDTLSNKMKSIDGVSSAYKVYQDKTMASDIDEYEDKIDDLEDKFKAMEDRYYSQFSAMETALTKLQSSSSSLSSLMGSSS